MAVRRRARLALIAGVLGGLAMVAALAWSGRRRDRPAEATAELHRVELDVPPVDAALWFAARYPGYFRSGERGLGDWLDTLDPRDREFVLAMAQTLTWAWVELELAGLDGRELDPLAAAAIGVVRHKTLNQLEINLDRFGEAEDMELDAYLGDPLFAAGVFARLVRGASNCEGQNHLLALLLGAALESELEAEMAGLRTRHDIVRLRGDGLAQPIYVDAWSNLPAFTVDPGEPSPVRSLDELGRRPTGVVPGLVVRSPFAADVYTGSGTTPIVLVPERDAPTRPVDLEVRAPKLDEASLRRIEDPWRLYLYARILHIYDDPRAADVYRSLIDRHCMDDPRPRTFSCAAALRLRKRLPGGPDH